MQQFQTYLFITLYYHVVAPVEEVNTKIQCPHVGATEVEVNLTNLATVLDKKRSEFDNFWTETSKKKSSVVDEPTLPRQKRVPKKLD